MQTIHPMKTFISLNKNVGCDKVCSIISKLISQYNNSNQNIADCVLVIEIQQPIDYVDIPKIEYKENVLVF